MEKNLRRALTLSGGDWSVLVSSPITIAIWGLTLAGLLLPWLTAAFGRQESTDTRGKKGRSPSTSVENE